MPERLRRADFRFLAIRVLLLAATVWFSARYFSSARALSMFGNASEFTSGSDVDWTVLIDGFANPKHLDIARET